MQKAMVPAASREDERLEGLQSGGFRQEISIALQFLGALSVGLKSVKD
jgi:hypothetical protein